MKGLKAKNRETKKIVTILTNEVVWGDITLMSEDGEIYDDKARDYDILEPDKVFKKESKTYSLIGKKAIGTDKSYIRGKKFIIISEPVIIINNEKFHFNSGMVSAVIVKDELGSVYSVLTRCLKILDNYE